MFQKRRQYFLFVNLDANQSGKYAYSVQEIIGIAEELSFFREHPLQVADLLILSSHLFRQHLHLKGQRLLVALQTPETFIDVLALKLTRVLICLEMLCCGLLVSIFKGMSAFGGFIQSVNYCQSLISKASQNS